MTDTIPTPPNTPEPTVDILENITEVLEKKKVVNARKDYHHKYYHANKERISANHKKNRIIKKENTVVANKYRVVVVSEQGRTLMIQYYKTLQDIADNLGLTPTIVYRVLHKKYNYNKHELLKHYIIENIQK